MTKTFEVAIVGFGPAGAVAAGLLGAQGISTFVCDKAPDVYEMPRAFALDHEIMRVFQQLGIEEQVLAYAEPFTPSEFFGVDGQLIKRFTTADPPYPLGYVPSLVFTQPPVERVLRSRVQGMSTVEIALSCEFLSLHQDDEGVTLELRNEDGSNRQVRAQYLVACDGAASPVRNAVSIELEDLGFDQPWLVVDVLVNESGLAKLPATSVQYCEPQRPSTFLIGPGNHRRWEISINEGEDPKRMATPDETWKLLARWLKPEDGKLWRQASYRFHALVADRWRAGRVFLAGDAAHQQPPFLGQGMCQGIRDVTSLAWRLGAVLKGQAREPLLDSYAVERKAHVTELTRRIKGIGQLVGERDMAKARARDAHLLAECGGVVKSVPRQNVQPALQPGLLYTQAHSARGTIFPQPWVCRGSAEKSQCADAPVRLDAIEGTGWRLVLNPELDQVKTQLEADAHQAAQRLGVKTVCMVGSRQTGALCEVDGVVRDWFKSNDCAAALVRPDHYIYGVAPTLHDIADMVKAAAVHAGYLD
jgi:3-(3-hydroxy-phenyl)propionate hydroxylase